MTLEMAVSFKHFATRDAERSFLLNSQTGFACMRVDVIKKGFRSVAAYLAQKTQTLILTRHLFIIFSLPFWYIVSQCTSCLFRETFKLWLWRSQRWGTTRNAIWMMKKIFYSRFRNFKNSSTGVFVCVSEISSQNTRRSAHECIFESVTTPQMPVQSISDFQQYILRLQCVGTPKTRTKRLLTVRKAKNLTKGKGYTTQKPRLKP